LKCLGYAPVILCWIFAGGTGDLAAKFSRIVGPEGTVVLADINDSMLKVGRDRLVDRGITDNVRFSQADAQYLALSG
jgi:demethylmenaquinone methyltransferase/2-methoxy-6-polyprenyl-1,4-benzoquinol methylase